MKRWLAAILMCLTLLTLPVHASDIDSWEIIATVGTDGTVKMSVHMVMRFDTPTQELLIPLGDGAKNVTVNGADVPVRKVDGVPNAVIRGNADFTGALQFDLEYTLRGCLDARQEWALVLPLLADGLQYSVERISFTINLPAHTTAVPTFTSGYQQSDVDNYITYTAESGVISGTVDTVLRDHENLIFTIATDPEVYPHTGAVGQHQPGLYLWAVIFGLLAAGYWLLLLRWKPVRTNGESRLPVGLNPGLLGCQLLTMNPDLALMILSWAQAGYVTIYMDRDMTVILHKRMPMGNEASSYEYEIFNRLFGHSQMVECDSRAFRVLRQKVDSGRPRVKRLFAPGGVTVIPQALGCLSGSLVWAAMADGLMPSGGGRWIVLLLAALAGLAVSWLGREGLRSLLSWDNRPGMTALTCCALTILMGILSGCVVAAVLLVLFQQILGLLLLFGAKRSEAGRLAVQSILSLRKHLRTMSRKQVNRMIQTDPGYYYTMAPYALALGVDRAFARRFSQVQLGDCPWLVTELPPTGNARRWYQILRQVTAIIRGKQPMNTPAVPTQRRRRARV